MAAFAPNGALISIGGAILYTIGLNPQRLSHAGESRVPGHATQAGVDYQLTGMGERSVIIDARTFPHVTGGLDALAILTMHRDMQTVVPFIRLKGNYLGIQSGMVVVQSLEVDEEKLHPHDGVGRIVDVVVRLIKMPMRFG